MSRSRSSVIRNRLNALNHVAAELAGIDHWEAQRGRGAILWALSVIEAAIQIGTLDELQVIARMNATDTMLCCRCGRELTGALYENDGERFWHSPTCPINKAKVAGERGRIQNEEWECK